VELTNTWNRLNPRNRSSSIDKVDTIWRPCSAHFHGLKLEVN